MAFRYLYQISCTANIPNGFRNNTSSNVYCICLSLNPNTTTFQHQCLQSTLTDQSKSNLNVQELVNNETCLKKPEFLTSKKYYLQDSRRSERSYQVSDDEKRVSKEISYLQPSKLQPYKTGTDFSLFNLTSSNPLFSFDSHRKYSTWISNNVETTVPTKFLEFSANSSSSTVAERIDKQNLDHTFRQYLHVVVFSKTEATKKHLNIFNVNNRCIVQQEMLLSPDNSIRRFSSENERDCDCPPTASRNLTTIDSSYINYKTPNDVPPLPQKQKRCNIIELPRQCPQVKERTPRADDCYEVKPKKLPYLCPKTCPVVTEQLCEGKSISPLKKRPIQEPLKDCIKIPICECTPRADDCLKVKPRELPKIQFSNCPKTENCIHDVTPLKPLKKYESGPVKIPEKVETSNCCDRADSKAKIAQPTLSKIKFDFVPNTCSTAPPNIPINRLPNLVGNDPPKCECKEIKEKCIRSDDLALKPIPCALPTLILKPENNCVTTSHYKRLFTSIKRKYSILSAIKNPWTLSFLTANVIAYNYYHNVKPKKSLSIETDKFENDVRKNLSQVPTSALKKKSAALQSTRSSEKFKNLPNAINFKRVNTNSLRKKARNANKDNASKKLLLRSTNKTEEKPLFVHKKSRMDQTKDIGNINNNNKCRHTQPTTNIFPVAVPWQKMHSFSKQSRCQGLSNPQLPNSCSVSTYRQEESLESQIKKQWQNEIPTSSLKKNFKISFLVYSVNNHRAIHNSAKHYDKNDRKKKCGNNKCIKIKWPGTPPRQTNVCQKEYKHKICKKQKCPYPSYSECGSIGDFPTCECTEVPKLLQPRYNILPKLQLIKSAPPEWGHIDTDQEKKCVMDKLQMQSGETRTCDNFSCPPQHIGTEYLSEEEKECPPKKAKPLISCVSQTAKEPPKFDFKNVPPEEPICSSPPPQPQLCEPPCAPSKPKENACSEPKQYASSEPKEPKLTDKPTKCEPEEPLKPPSSGNFKNCDNPWSPPKKKCGPSFGLPQMIRFSSTSSQNTEVEPNKNKTMWEVVYAVFKTNLSKSCEEIKCICNKLHIENQSEDIKPTTVLPNQQKVDTFEENLDLATSNNECDTSKTSHCNYNITNSSRSASFDEQAKVPKKINVLESCFSEDLTQSTKCISTENLNPKKKQHKSYYLKCNNCGKLGGKLNLKKSQFKEESKHLHCAKVSRDFKKNEKICARPEIKKLIIPRNVSSCQLSTTSNWCKNKDDSNFWKKTEKSEPSLKDNATTPTPGVIPEVQVPIADSQNTGGKKKDWPECKTPIMKVCCEERQQTTCTKEYVHPKCEPQKAPFPSFSECHPPFPKLPVTECEVQRRNNLLAKQKLQIYSVEKLKHKYCIRCGNKSKKQYSTLTIALHTLGFNHCKRYFSSSMKKTSYRQESKLKHRKLGTNIVEGIQKEIKAIELKEQELKNDSYYKILKLLETYPEQEVYKLFDDPCNNVAGQKNNIQIVMGAVSKRYDEIEVDQLYKIFL